MSRDLLCGTENQCHDFNVMRFGECHDIYLQWDGGLVCSLNKPGLQNLILIPNFYPHLDCVTGYNLIDIIESNASINNYHWTLEIVQLNIGSDGEFTGFNTGYIIWNRKRKLNNSCELCELLCLANTRAGGLIFQEIWTFVIRFIGINLSEMLIKI